MSAPRKTVRQLEHLHDAAGGEETLLEDLENREGVRVLHHEMEPKARSRRTGTVGRRSKVKGRKSDTVALTFDFRPSTFDQKGVKRKTNLAASVSIGPGSLFLFHYQHDLAVLF